MHADIPPEAIEEAIEAHGDAVRHENPDSTQLISERLDKVELLAEQLGKSGELVLKLSGYIDDLRSETASLKRIRFWTVMFAVAFIVFELGMLVCILYFRKLWFIFHGPTFDIAVFVSSITAAVVLISVILKGAFRSVSDKASDDVLPPHLKEAYEAVKTAIGK